MADPGTGVIVSERRPEDEVEVRFRGGPGSFDEDVDSSFDAVSLGAVVEFGTG
jgi:hypothetical protein